MSLVTTVGVAKIGTKSLRATIPEGIVAFLELQDGDKLDWRMDFVNSEKVVHVRKSKTVFHSSTHVSSSVKESGKNARKSK